MLRRQSARASRRGVAPDLTRPLVIAAFVGFASSLAAFSLAAVIPSTESLSAHFEVAAENVQSSVTVYLVAYALMCVVYGPISDVLGRGQVIAWSLVLYLVSTGGCVFATTFDEFLIWRFGQGMSSGAGAVVGRAIIGDISAGQDAARLQGLITLIYAVTSPLAPVAGAVLTMIGGWSAVFWVLIGFAAVLLGISTKLLRLVTNERECRCEPHSFKKVLRSGGIQRDAFGLALYYASWWIFVGLSPILASGQGSGPMSVAMVIAPLSVGTAIGGAFALTASNRVPPEYQIRLGFGISAIALVLVGIAYAMGLSAQGIVLLVSLHAAGGAVVFPVVLTRMLGRFEGQSGLVSSIQSATTLAATALITDFISSTSLRLVTIILLCMLMFVISVLFLRSASGIREVDGH